MSARGKLALLLALGCAQAAAEEARIAVAANFLEPARELAQRHSGTSGHSVALSAGSTGKFYAQIKSGAPFDALLSADASTPLRLEQDGLAVERSRFTYAVGRLALWSPDERLVDDKGEVLRTASVRRLAIANPRLAPYGAAARQAMERLGVWHALEPRLVQGENIAQAYQFVWSRNAEAGFVALSQIQRPGHKPSGSRWLVPPELHAPLRQDAVLLAQGVRNAAARGFLQYLETSEARELIRAYGYDLP